MRVFLPLACASALAACAGIPTGERSPCFGAGPSEDTASVSVSTRGDVDAPAAPEDCEFERF